LIAIDVLGWYANELLSESEAKYTRSIGIAQGEQFSVFVD
jgi:hypothetical protein